MKTYVLYNPLAGNGVGEYRAKLLKRYLPAKELVFQSVIDIESYPTFLASIQEEDEVIVCGGDGTLNRFVNDTDGMEVKNRIYYWATGSGNDFWRDMELGNADYPCRVDQLMHRLPVVEVKGKRYHFLNGVGFGIDGYCCEVGDAQRKRSAKPVNYTSIAIKGLLFYYHPTKATVTVDGKAYAYEKAWLAPCMFGRYYGGGMMPTPQQDRHSAPGVSLMVLHDCGKAKALHVFRSIFKGEHTKYADVVTVLSGQTVSVAFDRPTPLQIDGETISNVLEYRVTAPSAESVAA